MSAPDGRLTSLVARVLELPLAQAAEARVDNTPGWDSLAHLALLMAVEEEYGVSFSPDEIAELESVELIDEAIDRLVGARTSQ
jgi:acyl carrier protein